MDPEDVQVLDALRDGELIPFLGAGVNLSERPAGQRWEIGHFLPNGKELAEYLATEFRFAPTDPWAVGDLLRVSQYAAVVRGTGPLYQRLNDVFTPSYPPTRVHRFFASLPQTFRQSEWSRLDLVVTTNYDTALERAFEEAGEPYDLVSYVTAGEARGRFMHLPHSGPPRVIQKPNEYDDLPLGDRTVILKIHGAVAVQPGSDSSYVITEDDYIDFLARMDVHNPLPKTLLAKMRQSGFLFLGYSLRDWNLRVILYRIWGEQRLTYASWAVQKSVDDLEERFWARRGVTVLSRELQEYVETLKREMEVGLRSDG